METLDRDQAYAIHQLRLDNVIKPSWRHGSGTFGSEAAKIYFRQLTQTQLRKLHDKFRLDLELFGYSAEEYYDYATALK